MGLSTDARLDAMERRITELESKFDALTVDMDSDTGITDTDHAATHNITSNDPVTVTNITAAPNKKMVKFKDATGREWLLGPGDAELVTGVTSEMTDLETEGCISIVP